MGAYDYDRQVAAGANLGQHAGHVNMAVKFLQDAEALMKHPQPMADLTPEQQASNLLASAVQMIAMVQKKLPPPSR